MKATQLRQSILQAAVQGKLVPQNIHDEPAGKLLEHIRAGKAQLVKEGKIKKEKPLPPIAKDDVPYVLPDGWVWCRFGDICQKLTDGSHNPPPNTGRGYPVISAKNVKNGLVTLENATRYTDQKGFDKENPRTQITKGDLILGIIGGSIGNLAVYTHTDKVIAQRSIAIIKTIDVDSFAAIFIRSPLLQDFLGVNASGTAQGGFYLGQLKNIIFPLPPLSEQQRIVAKVDELMALCDELEAAEKEMDKLETDFAEYLPKSILQAAVQGKLVPQNIHDEPADKLLERIRAEKVRLVKEGKIKKGKPLPPITEDEKPYDLPKGWIWCRLGEIIDLLSGRDLAPNQYNDQQRGIPYITGASSFDGEEILINRWTTEQSVVSNAGDLLLSCKGTVGKIALNNIGDCHIARQIMALRFFSDDISKEYVKVFLMSYVQQLIIQAKSMIPGISREDVLHSLVLLPPLAEQQRIVARVDGLMALCDELKAAKDISLAPAAPKVIPFPTHEDNGDEELRIVARGDVQSLSDEAMRDIDELFGDEAND